MPGLKQRIERIRTDTENEDAILIEVLEKLDKTIAEIKTRKFVEEAFKQAAKKCNWLDDKEERTLIIPLLMVYTTDVLKTLDSKRKVK